MKIYTVTKVGDKYDVDFFSDNSQGCTRRRLCNNAIAFVKVHPRFCWFYGEMVDVAGLDGIIARGKAAGYVKFKSDLLIHTIWDD